MGLSIVIPTYGREQVLLDSISNLRRLEPPPLEIIVVDQTRRHEAGVEESLRQLSADRIVRHIRMPLPSIPGAMNRGLREARGDIVLFLDDDIIPDPQLIAAHLAAHARQSGRLIAGRVIQPWEEGIDFSRHAHFHFASTAPAQIDHFMGGNFSLRREEALRVGGFDENFVKVAYRFEAEFAHRWIKGGGMIDFEPSACIHHLKAVEGGTRSFGEHLTTWLPAHSVGAYYCELRIWRGARSLAQFVARPIRSVATRFHLRRPWRIPATLTSELLGVGWALWLAARGPALMHERRHSQNV